jgi:hypothetical protein
MPYVPFDEYFPKLAKAETRVITILPGDVLQRTRL